jgi:hypothetical protein
MVKLMVWYFTMTLIRLWLHSFLSCYFGFSAAISYICLPVATMNNYVQRVNCLSLYSSVGIRFVLLLISESIIGDMVIREKLHKGRLLSCCIIFLPCLCVFLGSVQGAQKVKGRLLSCWVSLPQQILNARCESCAPCTMLHVESQFK